MTPTPSAHNRRAQIGQSPRLVVKIGSALLTNEGRGLDKNAIAGWVAQMAAIVNAGHELVLVSSGAVAAGMTRLGWKERPSSIHELQAAAAVGQMGLIQTYEEAFGAFGIATAQILLDHDDLSSRERYLNARSTLRTLTGLKVVPVVNENDTVVTDEIRFGDNDTLGALVANLIEANTLILLTDQLGMYNADPRKNPDAVVLDERAASDASLDAMAGGGGVLGRGGMATKLRAGRLAARSGANTIIVGGRIPDVLTRVMQGENLGTLLYAQEEPMAARKQWLAGQLQVRGTLVLDDGAVQVLTGSGKSLLPVGVKQVQGEFTRGDLVSCKALNGREIARGLVNYHADEARKIAGKPSSQITDLLGYKDYDELIHRDNLILV